MLTNFKDILQDAYRGKYSVGSFNVYNYETMRGVADVAIETSAPLLIAFGERYLENMSLKTVHAIAQALLEDSPVSVCLHLDHCTSMSTVYQAIKAGFGSVMYDGSMLPFEENMANTKLVCDVAHACGVSVEAELGSLASGEHSHEGKKSDKENYTDPDAAKEFVETTNVDALAVSIGTVHGLYKGEPNIRVDILKELNAALGIPLVLHGGSGTPEETIRECIRNGICKININTEISMHVIENTARLLGDKKPHYSVLSLKQADLVAEVVKKYMSIFAAK